MIKNIKIQKFKTIGNENFELSNLNIFTGLNGMGKSTVFQSLLLVRQSYLNSPIGYDGTILLNAGLIRLGFDNDVFAQYADGEKKIIFEFIIDNETGKWEMLLEDQIERTDIIKATTTNTDYFFHTNLFNDNFIYLSADRVGPQLSYPMGNLESVKKKRLGNKGEFALQYLSLLADDDLFIPELKHKESKSLNILSNINGWLGEISPGVKINVIPNLDFEAMRLSIQFDSGPDNVFTNEYRPINVGFGLTYILSIVIALITAKKGDILILENPEAHLHPRGQSQIAKLISIACANSVQCFIETHSDHIINGVRMSVKNETISNQNIKIFFFDRKKGNPEHTSTVHRIEILQDAKLTKFPDGFFDEWNKTLVNLVSPKK